MPTERIQRWIDHPPGQAETAVREEQWDRVRDLAERVLAIDAGDEDAPSLIARSAATRPHQSLPLRFAHRRPPPPASFASGRYELREFVGEGGKKRVFLARHSRRRGGA